MIAPTSTAVLDGADGHAAGHDDHGTDAGATGDAEDAGLGQRVAAGRLHHRPGQRERGTAEHGRRDARRPLVESEPDQRSTLVTQPQPDVSGAEPGVAAEQPEQGDAERGDDSQREHHDEASPAAQPHPRGRRRLRRSGVAAPPGQHDHHDRAGDGRRDAGRDRDRLVRAEEGPQQRVGEYDDERAHQARSRDQDQVPVQSRHDARRPAGRPPGRTGRRIRSARRG